MISLDKDLATSMFTRMYFLQGAGLRYFKQAAHNETFKGNDIYVYTIEWPE